MKTIIITVGVGLVTASVTNEHVTSLGDAILKTKAIYPNIRLKDIIAVETIEGDDVVPYTFTVDDLKRHKQAEQFDNQLTEAFRLLLEGDKIIRERDTHDHTQALELDIDELYPRPDQCSRPVCDFVEVAEHLNGGNPVKQYPCRAKCNDAATEAFKSSVNKLGYDTTKFTKHFDAND